MITGGGNPPAGDVEVMEVVAPSGVVPPSVFSVLSTGRLAAGTTVRPEGGGFAMPRSSDWDTDPSGMLMGGLGGEATVLVESKEPSGGVRSPGVEGPRPTGVWTAAVTSAVASGAVTAPAPNGFGVA
jgi:hypothetical protein